MSPKPCIIQGRSFETRAISDRSWGGVSLTQRGQASVTLQPEWSILLAGIKMVKRKKQLNSLAFLFLFNKLQSTNARMFFCSISSCIEAKCTHNCH